MDIIVFSGRSNVLYRKHKEHEYETGKDGVVQLFYNAIELPYAQKPASIENLCGYFLATFNKKHYSQVMFEGSKFFGKHTEIYHLNGTMQVYGSRVQVKGVRGYKSLMQMGLNLGLPDTTCKVHMAVFSLNIGKRLQTYPGSLFERNMQNKFQSLRVVSQMFDTNLFTRLRIKHFNVDEMPIMKKTYIPSSVDVRVSNKGGVLVRMSWKNIVWSEEIESNMSDFCNWLATVFVECC